MQEIDQKVQQYVDTVEPQSKKPHRSRTAPQPEPAPVVDEFFGPPQEAPQMPFKPVYHTCEDGSSCGFFRMQEDADNIIYATCAECGGLLLQCAISAAQE
jgi:hypothetical protein